MSATEAQTLAAVEAAIELPAVARRHVNSIANRLSLRAPQRRSLEILARLAEILPLRKEQDAAAALETVRSEFPSVEDFERDFPSLCFALATGVGKTRLMGAFVAYLHLARGVRHFFVLAPNLTIYEKLIRDFTPGHGKYVLQGIAEFAATPPEIVTGDTYESARSTGGDLFGGVHVNIFNISKINSEVRGGSAPRIKRLQEYIGESYFDYLAGLDDLVLLMDESHRYRGSAGVRAINELRPILGLELTATPQTETGTRTQRFRNVIYDYPLARAMADGFVKEPAVATRENFDAGAHTPEQLERLKLEDGVRLHEEARVQLETYALQNELPLVRPFMLVVARDVEHAAQLERLMQDEQFFEGRYRDRVITVHSALRGEEKEENVQRLLDVEHDERTEVVIHVNMLKEGWDVTNLYTIVPLRAADSRTLVEQSIGRGLRLPYGRRTGVKAVDRLTIVAHDRFQEIVDEANRPGSALRMETVYLPADGRMERRTTHVVVSRIEQEIAGAAAPAGSGGGAPSAAIPANGAAPTADQPSLRLATSAEQQVARATMEAVRRFEYLPRAERLLDPAIQAKLVHEVKQAVAFAQTELEGVTDTPDVASIVERTTQRMVELTIDVPRIVLQPKGTVTTGFNPFALDAGGVRYAPVEQDILVQELRTRERDRLRGGGGVAREADPRNYLVRQLIDYNDISYDHHADLLYDLAGQMVDHLHGYLSDEDRVENVLQFYAPQLAALIHAQMQQHRWQSATEYEAAVSRGFVTLRANAYTAAADEGVRTVHTPLEERQYIRGMLFGGFRRCLYPVQKFDSDAERRFAALLETDTDVTKWFKPGRTDFKIFYGHDQSYEPDFVVETATAKLLCEPKRADLVATPEVQAKAVAAVEWCRHASTHEQQHGGKPWQYLLIPHHEIRANSTLAGLAARFTMR
jgi:type III restriction enzyme